MKRLAGILILLCYLATSVGVSLREHYCMGSLLGASLSHPATDYAGDHHCTRCGMQKSLKDDAKGCCKDVVKLLKSALDQTAPQAFSLALSPAIAILPALLSPATPGTLLPTALATLSTPAHGPPRWPGHTPLYLRIRCLRL